jgi:hypothetical protein
MTNCPVMSMTILGKDKQKSKNFSKSEAKLQKIGKQ